MKYKYLTILILTLQLSCSQSEKSTELKSGDLLFRQTMNGKLSQAIDQVTQTGAETHFSHVGLVEIDSQGIWVLHAEPENGTCRISLDAFMHPEHDTVQITICRLKPEWQTAIPEAVKRAHQMLGTPYNFSYVISDSTHYCSEFIYRSFAPDSIFRLTPMTFKDPESGEFTFTWIEYYKKLGIGIPEGLPGCNPNGMAASDKLEIIGKLK